MSCPGHQPHNGNSHQSGYLCLPSAVDSLLFALPMLTLLQALSALFITELVARAKGQTSCEPLMEFLVQQAEATNGYGSWDACCARTGVDCLLTRTAVPPGFEPCDAAHSARAGCNRLAQATVCMIGGDGEISDSPCGASIIRTCGSVIALGDGVATPFDPSSSLNATFATILERGVLETQLCCSSFGCTFASPCTSQYNLSACLSDGVNNICIPLDQPDNTTYAAQIVQDGHNCVVTSSTSSTSSTYSSSSSSTSSTPTTESAVPTQTVMNNNGGGNTAIIGGGVGGAVGFVFITVLLIVLCMRKHRHRKRNVPSNELPDQGAVATGHVPFFPDLPGSRSTSGYTPSLPSPQWTNAIGTLPSSPGSSHRNQNASEFLGNPQNPSRVHQDPHTNIIFRPNHRSQNINPSQVHQDPGASIIGHTAFQPPSSPPPPSFHTTDFPHLAMDTQAREARIAAPSFPGSSPQNQNAFELRANPRNPLRVRHDPHTNVITRPSDMKRNTSESTANPSQAHQDSGASAMPSSVMDTQAMEARIAALENRIVELSGLSSGVQVEGSRRGGAAEGEADLPRYEDLESDDR